MGETYEIYDLTQEYLFIDSERRTVCREILSFHDDV